MSDDRYSRFRFSAVVDWVDIEIQTASPTNGWTVASSMPCSFATPLDEEEGGAATRFRCRLQGPKRFADIEAALDNVPKGLASAPTISGMEVAFDAYARTAKRDELVALAGDFYRLGTAAVGINHRIVDRRTDDQPTAANIALRALLDPDRGATPHRHAKLLTLIANGVSGN